MSQIRVAINGFGRIGRNAFKIAYLRSDIDVVAINDIADTKTLAHLLKYDSNYGTYQEEISSGEGEITVGGKSIKVLSEPDPASLPWTDLGVEVVIESTGMFTKKEDASKHLQAGAKKVVISAASASDDIDTIILGVNEDKIHKADDIINTASCTTNSLGALIAVLDAEFGVQKSLLTTVHSYTKDQALQDTPTQDLRTGRNAAENIVPMATKSAINIAKALPQLDDKIDGLSMRVPTSVVSVSDVSVLLGRNTTVQEINEVLKAASKEPFYEGILGVSEEPLVSRDYIGSSYSGVVDLLLTKVAGGNLAKIIVWYDNEWGYSNRLVELVADVGRTTR